MVATVHIVDYNVGNLQSVRNAFDAIGADTHMARTPEDVTFANRLVLPGVGAAGAALERLRARGLEEPLREAVFERGRPILGICVGMQMMAQNLYEFGEHAGLGWFKGEVVSLRQLVGSGPRVPHMGWNNVVVVPEAANSLGIPRGSDDFYFAHSYALTGIDEGMAVGTTDCGVPITAIIQKDTIRATQFHPEKSQIAGAAMLNAFIAWSP